MKFNLLLIGLLFSLTMLSFAQPAPKDWQHRSPSEGYPGVSTNQLYDRLPTDISPDTVIVAVIDGGVDPLHEDLKNVMWINKDEIPGNNIDDDKNGYIDDIYGWNFIGNAKGENVHYDNLEVARLYAKYRDRFKDVDSGELKKKEKAEYDFYQELKEEVEEGRAQFEQNFQLYSVLKDALEKIKEDFKDQEEITEEDLRNYETDDMRMMQIAQIIATQMAEGGSFEDFAKEIEGGYDYLKERFEYNYNPDFDGRAKVDDNYADKTERYYGNNDVKGPDAFHGTHVAGIIAAERNNDLGMDGIAGPVKIMAIRTVPAGDERDKDVANAIYYAVDNGASVINMSFGKGYSPYKEVVDKAVKYAAKKDVLLVHAAGNDGQQVNSTNNFPTDKYARRGLFGPKHAPNWIEVGAANWEGGENLAASFSNYSPEYVDVFAPGTAIYSTAPDNEYENSQGTSMAAPVVAGVAAVLRAYFPDLTAEQVKEIISTSTDQPSAQMVIKPGTDEKVPFSELSVSGGVINVEKAVEKAIQTKGKKRKAAERSVKQLKPNPKA
jgi:subtilisin family serine protease